MSIGPTVECSKCHEEKLPVYFPRHSKICNTCKALASREWYKNNKERAHNNSRRSAIANAERTKLIRNKSTKTSRFWIKELIVSHYSGGKNDCACCGENTIEFLTVDHMNNDGAAERKITGSGSNFYWWLKNNDFPAGYQILCYNCNCGRAKTKDKTCPHTHALPS